MMNGAFRAFARVDKQIIEGSIREVVHQAWPHVQAMLTLRFREAHLIKACSKFVDNSVEVLGESLLLNQAPDFLPNLNKNLTFSFSSNLKNLSAVSSLCRGSSTLAKLTQPLTENYVASLNEVAETILRSQLESESVDVDLVGELALVLTTLGDIDIVCLLLSSNFAASMQLLVRVLESVDSEEMNQRIVQVFVKICQTMGVKFGRKSPEA
mmetsp:Transcript_1199/g.2193  ORF Transcript_1199/g.2193 Transcript_1199/m.2193 type:complete len:211 (+) Transcript_1199:2173-2805(+)